MTADTETDVVEVDARGLRCPEPVMLLHGAIRRSPVDGLVRLIATDPSTQRDVPQFCRFLEHELIDSEADDAGELHSFLIRKRG